MGQANAAGPQAPLVRNNTQGGPIRLMLQARGRGAWGPQTAQSNFAGPQARMARNNNQGGQNRLQLQARGRGAWGPQMARNNKQGGPNRMQFQARMRGGWGPQLQQPSFAGPQQRMARRNSQVGPLRMMLQARARRAWGPQLAQPNVAGPQQRQQFQQPQQRMVRPNAAGQQLPQQQQQQQQQQKVRPNAPQAQVKPAVAVDNSPVSRIRHLRQAAEQLTAAGYPEYAAKARAEVSRLEAELKQSKPAAPAINKELPRRDLRSPAAQATQAEAGVAPDVNTVMLNEMRQLSKQIAQLNGRMQKLEARSPQ